MIYNSEQETSLGVFASSTIVICRTALITNSFNYQTPLKIDFSTDDFQ